MRAGRFAVVLGLVLVAAVGCADKGVKPEEMEAWVGRPAATLEKNWGSATREVQDGDLRILIYEEVGKGKPLNFNESTGTSRFFGGSADSLVLSLVETRHLTPEKLARIQKLLEEKDGND